MNDNAIRAGTLFAIASLALAACGTTKSAKKLEPTTTVETSTSTPAAAESGPTAPQEESEPSVRDTVLAPVSSLETVHFDYDSSKLGSEALATLAQNAAWLKEHEDATVQVAGNCDQRGTESYNLALGQRRAKAVRDYYRSLGVSGKRVATISYGKDKPVCKDDTEACWQKNRRAETLVASPKIDQASQADGPPATP